MNFWHFVTLSIIALIGMFIFQEVFRQVLEVKIEGKFWDKLVYGTILTVFDVLFYFLVFAAVFGEFKQ